MNPRLVVVALAVAGIGAAVVAAGLQTDEAASGPEVPGFGVFEPIVGCIDEHPEPIPEPEHRPGTLPLPEGSFAVEAPPDPAPGLQIVIYVVPTNLDAFVQHVLDVWPAEGWELGRGEREAGEAESVFFLPDKSRYGQIRVRQIYCDTETVQLTLTLGRNVG